MGSDLGKVTFPADARIIGMSEHFDFNSNDIAYKFESIEFEPVMFPERIPVLRPPAK